MALAGASAAPCGCVENDWWCCASDVTRLPPVPRIPAASVGMKIERLLPLLQKLATAPVTIRSKLTVFRAAPCSTDIRVFCHTKNDALPMVKTMLLPGPVVIFFKAAFERVLCHGASPVVNALSGRSSAGVTVKLSRKVK